jgi:hypothetical protein
MTDLTKKESAYFICFAIAALGVIIMTLWLWAGTQETCFDKYNTEDAAIQACEQ